MPCSVCVCVCVRACVWGPGNSWGRAPSVCLCIMVRAYQVCVYRCACLRMSCVYMRGCVCNLQCSHWAVVIITLLDTFTITYSQAIYMLGIPCCYGHSVRSCDAAHLSIIFDRIDVNTKHYSR